ncbi:MULTISPECIES: hypothetical protein [Bizionia]|uniref:Uncharacterized protein n=1 Tax=Bizionia algoritergicola TaxID=291187 RepID=A0A5D0QK39_9FLAO|nr:MULTISPECIES: hypothetical protein [Bizionia]OBX17892.1 hypothetical protein BAA08_15685 [Bizionia sp. APA-3]TYB69530.1 hypothetical protein ES675_16080 [Bizionia algoritergicola]
MNPEDKELAEKVIDFFKKSKKSKLIPATDLKHLLPDNNIAEKVIYPLEKDFGLIERCGKSAFRLTNKGWDFTSFSNFKQSSDFINNDFSNSTIGQFNQADFLKNKKTEIKQNIQPKTNEKQQNAIISFIEKFWWQILIPLAIGIILILIEKGIINIGI